MNALVTIDVATLTPAVFSEAGGVDTMLESLVAKVRATQTDVTTPAGRKAIRSLAHQVARSKTAFDDFGKDLVADLKKQSGAIDAERKKVRDRLDALKEEVLAPVEEFEAIEAKRIADHQSAIQSIIDLGAFDAELPASADVIAALTALDALPERDWQEFKQKAAAARSETFAKLQALKGAAITREEQAVELARLRAEQAAREQREREEKIAAEAAAKATRDAEEKAAAEAKRIADETAKRERKAAQEKAAAIAAAEKAKRDAEEAAAKAERDRLAAIAATQEAEAKAERDRLAAIAAAEAAAAKAEQDRIAAEAKAETDRLAAIEAERVRVAKIAAAEAAETARREADKAHKKTINTAAKEALIAAGLSEADAIKAITAIALGNVPNVKISY